MTADAPVTCAICGLEEPDARLLARCFDCGATFHLNPRSDVEGIDCGDAWIGESLGIMTYCATCIARIQEETLAAEGANAAAARNREMMQAMMPGAPLPPRASTTLSAMASESARTASGSGPAKRADSALPPRSKRTTSGRRYRRVDP